MNKLLYGIAGVITLAVLVAGFMFFNGSFDAQPEGVLAGLEVTLYKSPSCECCKKYAAYLETRGDAEVQSIDRMNMQSIKTEYDVPGPMESCHTSIVGNYIVEGHVPMKAIQKLLHERPDIAGIALPEMPRGSPGMNGLKTERFQIFAIQHDGSYVPYIEL
jgi:hypothetical protein